MRQVTLQFNDVLKLVDFLSTIGQHNLDANVDEVQVTGALSEAATELAVNGYGALLVSNREIA